MSNELALINEEISELKQIVSQQKTNRLNDSLFSKELAPHYQQLATQLSKSSMVPKSYQGKPQDLFVAMALGYQVGLSVEQAIQSIAVINGKPTLWGDDMLALCMAHKDFVDICEEPIMSGADILGYTCTIKRKSRSDTVRPFTLEMAKKAGLLGKQGPWVQYTSRMLQLRARSFALRDSFPDALKGIKSREEVEDYIEGEYTVGAKKQSRVEALKQDILSKKEEVKKDDQLVQDNEVKNSHQETTETPISRDDKDVVVSASEARSVPSSEGYSITAKQEEEIKKLINEKEFNDDRIRKAFSYYDVSSLEEFSMELAEHFIDQLNKS